MTATSHRYVFGDPDKLGWFGVWEYRAMVIENAGLTDAWRNPDWLDDAACRDTRPTIELCNGCPVQQECLAAALVTDSPAALRAGLTRKERADWFAQLDLDAQVLDPWLAERGSQLRRPGRGGV